MSERVGEQLARLIDIIVDVNEPIDFHPVLRPFLNVVEITIVGAQRVVSSVRRTSRRSRPLFLGLPPAAEMRAALLERALAVLGFRRHNPSRPYWRGSSGRFPGSERIHDPHAAQCRDSPPSNTVPTLTVNYLWHSFSWWFLRPSRAERLPSVAGP